MKPEGTMYQAVTKVNVLSPVIFNVIEVDVVHMHRRQYCYDRNRQGDNSSIGVLGNRMIQDGCYMNLGEPLSSYPEKDKYAKTSAKAQELANGLMVVGLTDSTQSTVTPYTRGSGQQQSNCFRDSRTNPQRFEE